MIGRRRGGRGVVDRGKGNRRRGTVASGTRRRVCVRRGRTGRLGWVRPRVCRGQRRAGGGGFCGGRGRRRHREIRRTTYSRAGGGTTRAPISVHKNSSYTPQSPRDHYIKLCSIAKFCVGSGGGRWVGGRAGGGGGPAEGAGGRARFPLPSPPSPTSSSVSRGSPALILALICLVFSESSEVVGGSEVGQTWLPLPTALLLTLDFLLGHLFFLHHLRHVASGVGHLLGRL